MTFVRSGRQEKPLDASRVKHDADDATDWTDSTATVDGKLDELADRLTTVEADDVSGPASSTNFAVARFSGTGGKTIQNSGVLIDNSDQMTGLAALTMSGDINANSNNISNVGNLMGVRGADFDVGINTGNSGAGDTLALAGGAAGAVSGGDGGDVTITAGNGVTSGDGGNVVISSGTGVGIGKFHGQISLVCPNTATPINVTGSILDANCVVGGGSVSAPKTVIKHKIQTGAFVTNDLAVGEQGVDTGNKLTWYSTAGTYTYIGSPVIAYFLNYTTTGSGYLYLFPGNAIIGDSNDRGHLLPFDGWVIGATWVMDVNASTGLDINLNVRKNSGSSWTDLLVINTGVLSVADGQRFSATIAPGTHAVSAGDVLGADRDIIAGTGTTDDITCTIWVAHNVTF